MVKALSHVNGSPVVVVPLCRIGLSMSIWFQPVDVAAATKFSRNTVSELLGIEFTEAGDDFIRGRMPVDGRTKQPAGLLHGGASVVLAESLASWGACFVIDPSKQSCAGLEINANHLRAVRDGHVTGTARPIHLGKTTQVWEVRIHDDQDRLSCISRVTMAILDTPFRPA